MENYALAMAAFRPGSTPGTTARCASWSTGGTPIDASTRTRVVQNTVLHNTVLQNTSVRLQPQVETVPSLADGRDAVAGVSNHDATAKSGPPRGEPR